MQAFDELIRVRTIGRHIPQMTASSPSDADRWSAPHTGGDEPYGGDEPAGSPSTGDAPAGDEPTDLYLRTNWSRILHYDLFSGQVDVRGETPAADAPERAPSVASASSVGAPARDALPAARSAARAASATIAFVVAAYLVAAGMSHLASPDAAASLGPALTASPAVARDATAPTNPNDVAAPQFGRRDTDAALVARMNIDAGPDASRECAPGGIPATDRTHP